MATFKELSANDFKTAVSNLEQVVDVIQADISGSSTRKIYQHFVTGTTNSPGVTSSMWQTVYDSDITLQTSNPIFDMTVGLFYSGSVVQNIKTGEDSNGKLLFPSTSLMMREKVDIYSQYAQTLLGINTAQFRAPFNSSDSANDIDAAMFLNFHRLFHRDQIKRETFAIQFYETSSVDADGTGKPFNIARTSERGLHVYTDAGSAGNKEQSFGGNVGNIIDSSDTSRTVGLLFYDHGIAVFDLEKIMSGSEAAKGIISAVSTTTTGSAAAGQIIMGTSGSGNPNAAFIPDFLTSGSIDNIVDHLASARFSSGTKSGVVFQNITNLYSTLVFCEAGPDEMNYSSNPTFVDSDNRIVVIDEGQEENQQTFVMFTAVGLYDANDNCLAVGKLSRPVEKNPEKKVTVRIRIDN